jgi:regulator of replication initiation timing
MDLSPYIMWNILLTLIVAPLLYTIRSTISENKRLDILLNKTREEMAKDYVTKTELEGDMERVFALLDKIEEKLDRLFEAK